MSLVNLVRKKILGKNLYNACKNRDLRVDNTLLQKRLEYIQSKGLFPNFTLNDIIHLCELKKKNVFAMDKDDHREDKGMSQVKLSGQTINITEEYIPIIEPRRNVIEKKEEETDDFTLIDPSEVPTEDELAELDHKLPEELHFLKGNDCMMFNVIENLHKLLIMRNVCFLQGAFVFADDNGNLFKRLLHRCDYQYRRRFGGITHDVFINPNKFDKRGKKSKLDKEFLRQQKVFYPNAVNLKMYMYEIDIQDKNKKHFEYNYACDEKCQEDDRDKKRCPDNIKQTKKIVLMYPFQVHAYLPEGKGKITKRYLYVKLEDDHAISLEHTVSASKAYFMNPFYRMVGYKQEEGKYPIRRERVTNSEEKYEKSSFTKVDNQFYDLVNADQQEVLFYNTYIRNHYEFFIPQNVTNSIIVDIEPEESSEGLP
jgi:hypothetical protein